jgi:hypothetical protein
MTSPTPTRCTPSSTASSTRWPKSYRLWRRIWMRPGPTSWRSPPSPKRPGGRSGPTTPKSRLNREIRRRTDVVGIFPDRTALVRLVGAVLAEQHDEWTEQRRYLGLDTLAKSRLAKITNQNLIDEEVTITAITA